MTKKIIITIISILSIIGFIFVLGVGISRRKNDTGSIFANVDLEKKKIEENIKKYQPQKTDKTNEGTLEISAKSAIVIDENTNEILYQKESDLRLPPASITKIATISVALENLKKEDLINISQKAGEQEPNKIVMKAGERMTLSDLMYGLMMISANDAAFAIAEAIPGGYDQFIGLMNEKVRILGLVDSSFKNPSGLDVQGHYSSAFDIATLTRYALLCHPEIIDYAGEKDDHSVYPTDHNESHWWGHISGMLYRYPGMIAAKTGYTEEAGSTFIGIAERDGRRLTVVFFGATDANSDVIKLLDFGFAN